MTVTENREPRRANVETDGLRGAVCFGGVVGTGAGAGAGAGAGVGAGVGESGVGAESG
eukprot:COSAG06_NODE_57693_length_279_cov_1.127778_1_plen_57_part_01